MLVEHFFGALRARVEANFRHAVRLVTRKGIVVLRNLTDDPAIGQLLEPVNGIHDIDIRSKTASVKVYAVMTEF